MSKGVLCLFTGIVIGSAATYFITKSKFEARAEFEIEEIRQHYIKKLTARENDEAKESMTLSTEAREENYILDNDEKNYGKIASIYSERASEPINYSIYKPNDVKELKKVIENTVEDEDPEEFEGFTYPREENTDPYTISPESFADEFDYFEKVGPLTYIPSMPGTLEFGTFYDEVGEVYEMDYKDIGDNISKFGEYEEDLLYIRNERTSTDYEIILGDPNTV